MHELTFAQQLIKKARQQGDVKSIILEVGELANITSENLERTLKEITKWNINIIKRKAVVRCNCGFKGEPKIIRREHDLILFVCPKCSTIPKVLDGKDIVLKEVEVEE
jgi:Zn finger protein HypA/HybF involved in hydrogenase expression